MVATGKVKTGKSRHAYATKALVLQGGGALGAYQAGVYEGLAESGHTPNWVAGISIGAINAALIAGNLPAQRVEKLRSFWEHICDHPLSPAPLSQKLGHTAEYWPNLLRTWVDALDASRTIVEGQRGFFTPRSWLELGLGQRGPDSASFYDTGPMKTTLEQFIDFDLLNRPQDVRISVGAVNVRTGNFVYFDNTRERLGPEHIMASGALPPGFPAVEIDGEFYWDGGIVSNTPLHHILTAEPRQDALIFQVDLWPARGELPQNLGNVMERQKEVQYSSRTRLVTQYMQETQEYRSLLRALLEKIPEDERDNLACARAQELACDARFNVLHLIYQDRAYEGATKDMQFGQLPMREHWASGLADIRKTLAHPHWLDMPRAEHPFVTHDVHRKWQEQPPTAAGPASVVAEQ